MVVKIFKPAGGMAEPLAYNEQKVKEGEASVLSVQNISSQELDIINQTFEMWERKNIRTTDISFHMAVNPGPLDRMNDDDAVQFAKDLLNGLGYGNQPAVIFKHEDIERTHYHVVSIRVDSQGHKVKCFNDAHRCQQLMKQLQAKFDFEIGNGGLKYYDSEYRSYPVFDPKVGDLLSQLDDIFHFALKYDFDTPADFAAIMRDFGIDYSFKTLGDKISIRCQGLDSAGKPCTRAITGKALAEYSLLPFNKIAQSRRDGKVLSPASLERVRNYIDSCRDRAHSSLHFQRMLAKGGIGVNFIRNRAGAITDVRFVDHKCRAAFKSDILGQPYNAISFNARIDNGTWDEEYDKVQESQSSSQSENQRPSIPIGEFLIAEGNSRGHERDPRYKQKKEKGIHI